MKINYRQLSAYTFLLSALCLLILLFNKIITIQPVKADDPHDDYPWINTFMYNNLKDAFQFTPTDVAFVADHFDIVSAHIWHVAEDIKAQNPAVELYAFTGPGYLSERALDTMEDFLLEHPATDQEKETVYIHYRCDVVLNQQTIPGCNLLDVATGLCAGTPADGCTASTALHLSESRVPDPDPIYQADGWLLPNYLSTLYQDFAVWDIRRILGLYGANYRPEGIFWDNILYNGSYEIGKTIEYWGFPDTGGDHPRSTDYHDFYQLVSGRVEQEESRTFHWLGNVNNMYWIRAGGPQTEWVLNNLSYVTPESWISPLNYGEYYTPAWGIDCADVQEAWDYSENVGVHLSITTYNQPRDGVYENPDQRTKKFSIAKYYLVNNSRLYYGYTEDAAALHLPSSQWNNMAEINLGSPRISPAGVRDFSGQLNTNKFFDWNHPTATLSCSSTDWENIVMARHYENGLVISRWKGQRWGESGSPPADDPVYNSYVDPILYPIANTYQQQYYSVEPAGTLSAEPVTSVTLSTNEAVVLLQICPAGPVSATCGCNGLVYEAGDVCQPNALPVLGRVGDITVDENTVANITVSASDPDCPTGSCLTFSLAGLGEIEFANLENHWDGTATVTLSPDFDSAGIYAESVRVTDTGIPPATDSETIRITVINQLHPPAIVEVSDRTIHELDQLDIAVLATDPKTGDRVTLAAANLPDGATFQDHGDNTGMFSWTPTESQSNSYPNIVISASDEEGSPDTEEFMVTVLDGVSGCEPNWQCTDWSVCSNSLQTRICTDTNGCGSDAGRPVETRGCDSTAPERIENLSAQ